MKILITGNLGYLGANIGKTIKDHFENCYLVGLDTGLFLNSLTCNQRVADTYYDKQIFMDVRDVNIDLIKGFNIVISLAAVSNDPIGKEFEEATHSINFQSTINLADICKKSGVNKFIFASSCSMYGSESPNAKTEQDPTKPLTAYAKTKIGVEKELKENFSSSNMSQIFLRFSTACGPSDRLRLDLVLNDFVASALKYNEINILSDGSPWRPLIDTRDIANSIIWAIKYKSEDIIDLSINVGCDEWNFQVKDIAKKVAEVIPGTNIKINANAEPDKRSYKVDFSLYKKLSGNFYPTRKLENTISELRKIIQYLNLPHEGFRSTNYIRLNHLKKLKESKIIDKQLRWLV